MIIVMKTIEAFERDVFLQPQYLQIFKPQSPINERAQKNTIFCGSGDSLSASFLAESFSNLTVRAADPLDLLKNKHIIHKHTIFLVSISGNTISNIMVAKTAKKAIAITSNPKSRLSKVCSRTINLQFPNSDVFTGGSLSFLQSALTCISLVTKIKIRNGAKIFKKAIDESKKIKFSKRLFILGNLHTYPVAMYAAAKFYEQEGNLKILDVGKWWHEKTSGLPVPLGINVMKTSFGIDVIRKFDSFLQKSIEFGLAHEDDALDYAMKYSRSKPRELIKKFVKMYVNDVTVNMGERGERSIRKMFEMAKQEKLVPEFNLHIA